MSSGKQQGQRIVLVDIEAAGKTPVTGHMTEFGAVDFETGASFHAHFFDFTPDPQIPAIPVIDWSNERPWWTAVDGAKPVPAESTRDVYERFAAWLDALGPERKTFMSDNNGYDFMWVACGFDAVGMANPFGHTSRRIGDLAAGLSGSWRRTSAWKRLRKTAHDHNPVNDCLGNAEALRALLREAGQAW